MRWLLMMVFAGVLTGCRYDSLIKIDMRRCECNSRPAAASRPSSDESVNDVLRRLTQ